MTLFLRDGLLKHKADFFEWDRIETVSYVHHTLLDKIFSKGDLMIKLDRDIEFPFENVNNPSKQVTKILHLKERHLAGKKSEDETNTKLDTDKISILNEALLEVVKEYLGKKNTKSEEEHDDFL